MQTVGRYDVTLGGVVLSSRSHVTISSICVSGSVPGVGFTSGRL